MRLQVGNCEMVAESGATTWLSTALSRSAYRTIDLGGVWHLFALVLVVILGVTFRVYLLDSGMGYDESFTYLHYASQPLAVGMSDYSYPNNHIFHTLLVHITYRTLGDAPWVLRLPAFLAGVLIMPAVYALGRLMYNKHAALLSTAFAACSWPLISYSTQSRGYTLLCLVFLLLLIIAIRIGRSSGLAPWLTLAVLAALGFYTIPIMLYPFGVVVLWILLGIVFQPRDVGRAVLLRRLCGSVLLSALLTGLLYLPVFLVSGVSSLVSNRFVAPLTWDVFVAQWPGVIPDVWTYWNLDVPAPVSWLLALGFAVALVRPQKLTDPGVALVAAVVLWIFPLVLLQRVVPPTRVWLFLLPLYLLLACAGLTDLLQRGTSQLRKAGASILPLATVLFPLWFSANYLVNVTEYFGPRGPTSCRGFEGVARVLAARLEPHDRVLAIPDAWSLRFYMRRAGLDDASLVKELESAPRVLAVAWPKGSLGHLMDTGLPNGVKYGTPVLVEDCGFASIYELSRS